MTRYDPSDPDAVSFCPSCGTGYRAGPIDCVDCGEPLVSRTEMESLSGGEGHKVSWVLLADVPTFKAGVLNSALEEASIEFVAWPRAAMASTEGTVQFLVHEGDHDAASRILEELEQLEQSWIEDEAEGEGVPIEEILRDPDRVQWPPSFDLSDPDAVCFCPACGLGYRAGFSRCADCDEVLVSRSQVEDWLRE